jgi:stearoyl-CoA desaturase (delta-9 desaturase)
VVAISLIPYWGFGGLELGLLIPGYFLTLSGVEVGFHRLYAHRAFQGNKGILLWFAILGSMAAEGPLVNWAATHRRHHSHSDQPGDPHSPVYDKTKKLNPLAGFWHSHMGWMLNPEVTNSVLYAKDLLRNPMVAWVNRWYLGWVGLGLLIPALLGWGITGTWVGIAKGFLWGGLVRIFFVHHATWVTNSLGHIVGNRPYTTGDNSTNNFWLSIPCIGISWHNNHHAFASSAIHGLEWWQPDPGAWVLRVLEKLGWVWNLRIPTDQMKQAKRQERLSNG